MSILVTRPHPDNEATAGNLRARGFVVLLAPMLKFEPVAFHDEREAGYGAIIVTSGQCDPRRRAAIAGAGCWSCRCSRSASTRLPRRANSASRM